MSLSRDELTEIFNGLKRELTPENLKWLDENAKIPWSGCNARNWNETYASSKARIHERITEILDAKLRRKREHWYSDRLDSDELWEIAEKFSLDKKVYRKIGMQKIAKKVLEEVRKCKNCQGTGSSGTASSTEGPTNIVCLACLGTGKASP